MPSLTNGVFGEYLRALHDMLLPEGFQVLVLNSGYVPGKEERAIATMLGQHPEAIIVSGVDQTRPARRMLDEAGIPVIQTMEMTDDPIDIVIGLNQEEAGYAATRHLIDLGHRHIGQMAAPLDSRALKRRRGYRRAIAEAGLEAMEISLDAPSTFAYGAELFEPMLARWSQMTGIYCGNDNLALGVLFAAQRRGMCPTTCRSSASTISSSRRLPTRRSRPSPPRVTRSVNSPPRSCSRSFAVPASGRRADDQSRLPSDRVAKAPQRPRSGYALTLRG